MAQKAIGQVQGGNALAGPLDGANAELEGFQRTCSLLPAAVLRVFHETNTIFRNTRPVLNAADVARATAFNVVQAAEAV